MKRFVITTVAAITILFGATPKLAHAALFHPDQQTFIEQPETANAVTTMGGYLFEGMPYVALNADGSIDFAQDSAVGLFLGNDLADFPLAPITSVSAELVVTGNVEPAATPAPKRSHQRAHKASHIKG